MQPVASLHVASPQHTAICSSCYRLKPKTKPCFCGNRGNLPPCLVVLDDGGHKKGGTLKQMPPIA